MAIYNNDGTTDYEIGKLYDNDGTTDYQIGKGYDNDGTINSEIYSAEAIFFSNGTLHQAFAIQEKNDYGTISISGSNLVLGAYNGCASWVGWRVNVNGYKTLKLTVSSIDNPKGDGVFAFAAVYNPPSYGSNLRWDGSKYNGVGGDSKNSAGTHTLDVSSLRGDIYVCISTTAGTKHWVSTYISDFRLI